MDLYRPTGLVELQLVLQLDLAGWPPRLPEQPIFYPVLNRGYAAQIARDWNTKADARAGYVTRFEIDDDYAARFQRKVVGGREHEELWVPAEELTDFNRHIRGPIRVIDAFFGEGFVGLIPEIGALRELDASTQLIALSRLLATGGHPRSEVFGNREAVFLHYLFWQSLPEPVRGLFVPKSEVLAEVRAAWKEFFPTLPLPERGD